MTLKNEARKLGKVIRRQTGLPLPIAQRAAKLIVKRSALELIEHPLVSPFVKERSCGGSGCSCFLGYNLSGPKGEYSIP